MGTADITEPDTKQAVLLRTGCDGGVLVLALAPDADRQRVTEIGDDLRTASGLKAVIVADVAAVKAWHPHDIPAELGAAMAETRQLRGLVAEILGHFGPSGSGHTARVGQVQIAKWRDRAGLGDDGRTVAL
jgi:hypothetical protein